MVPVLALLISLIIPGRKEMAISLVAFLAAAINLAGFIFFLAYRASLNLPAVNLQEFILYENGDYRFVLDFYFDRIGAVYLITGALVTFIITMYSRYYMHREEGYKRFFSTVLLFYAGYNFTILAGNFETLLIGWEILGISSFLLIAFYRNRYLPVRNAVRVFSIYRIGDVGLFLAMWASHHLWHGNITFIQLHQHGFVHHHLVNHSAEGVFISLMILLPALAKSAQLPFSSWLPRAMEGPTPSSAIFYGALSVHIGAFLLLRTYPFWSEQFSVRILIGAIGLFTAIVCFLIARVQPTLKSKIAYASITQIGIIFWEIAMGWHVIALVHFAGNAFLRTYQLLVSPSMVSYIIRDQFYHFTPHRETMEDHWTKRWKYSLYVLTIKEWNLDGIMNRWVFRPLKQVGKNFGFLNERRIIVALVILYAVGWVMITKHSIWPELLRDVLPLALSIIGLMLILRAFVERRSSISAWLMVMMSHFWTLLAVSATGQFDLNDKLLYLSGVALSGLLGFMVLKRLGKSEPGLTDLNAYRGHHHDHPRLAFIFLLCCLGLMGFPITTTFLGEDLIFSHVDENHYFLALSYSIGFVITGIALIRIYARVFLGPHCKTSHPTPLRSS